MLEQLDGLIAAFVTPLQGMGFFLAQDVTLTIPGSNGGTMPLSTAALTGFLMPWVDNLGAILTALAKFLDFL